MVVIQKLRGKRKSGSGNIVSCLGIFRDKENKFWMMEGNGHSAIPEIFSFTNNIEYENEVSWIELKLNPGYKIR